MTFSLIVFFLIPVLDWLVFWVMISKTSDTITILSILTHGKLDVSSYQRQSSKQSFLSLELPCFTAGKKTHESPVVSLLSALQGKEIIRSSNLDVNTLTCPLSPWDTKHSFSLGSPMLYEVLPKSGRGTTLLHRRQGDSVHSTTSVPAQSLLEKTFLHLQHDSENSAT